MTTRSSSSPPLLLGGSSSMQIEAPLARILLVDDHPPNLVALRAILDPLGQELAQATSGPEALRALLEGDFALILMDVQMPGMDGIETAKLIKERSRNKHIPIVFLTAIHKDPSYIFRGYKQGAVDYLLKPFDPEILRAKVQVFVELWRTGELVRRQQAMLLASERIELEKKSELRFRGLTDSMPQCVWAAGSDGVIYYCNRVWREYAGPEVGIDFFPAVPAEELDEVRRTWREAVRTGTALDREQRLRRHDGELRWHLCRMVPERDEYSRTSGWICTATDIDRQKRTEEANAKLLESETLARNVAEVANRTKDEFLATVSHELRTPLNAILGWTRMLRTGAVDPKSLQRVLETIERNARAQTQLVEDILDVSRIIAGKVRVNIQPMDLHAVARAAIDAVKPASEAKDVQIVPVLEAEAPEFYGDPDRLQQVIWNLLANAIKFTPRGGKVELKVEKTEAAILIVVTDTGMGIDRAFLPHVFDRFRQADSSITRAQGGLGLGLAIVRHLIEVHGGTVRADSEGEGKGSRFTVEIPRRANAPAPEAARERGEAGSTKLTEGLGKQMLAGLDVLVVDDEPDARDLVAAVLSSYGASVRTCGSVEEAFALHCAQKPDVLLSDIGLPGEDGYALMRRIRALGEAEGGKVPAAALTAYASAEDHQRALDAGFHVHVTKPIEPTDLAMLVASLAGRAAEEPVRPPTGSLPPPAPAPAVAPA